MFMVTLAVQKFPSLISSRLFLFAFISIALGDLRKHWYNLCSTVFTYVLFEEFYGVMSHLNP